MWNSEPLLASVAWWSLVFTAVFGGLAVVTGLVGGVAATRASDIKSADDAKRIAEANARAEESKRDAAEANARAEEAKADAARANERLQKSQEMRRLRKPQAELLKPLLESPLFHTAPKPTLRVSTVADAEAASYALELQNFLASCGVNIFPTNAGLPSGHVQLCDHPTGLALGVKSLEATDVNQPFTRFQNAAVAVGLDIRVEINESLGDREAVLYVMRKPPET